MTTDGSGLLVPALVGLAIVALLFYVIVVYNSLVAVRREADRAWSNIDVLLKQRFDELPKLVDACMAYMKFEHETLAGVIAARTTFTLAQSVDGKARAAGASVSSLRQLFALAEHYPDLKTDDQFRHLRERISLLEARIADRRETYNDVVNAHNTRIAQLPDMLLAQPMGYQPLPLFEVPEPGRTAHGLESDPSP